MSEIARREFVNFANAFGLTSIAGPPVYTDPEPKFIDYPFTLGVASGDPLSSSVVLWTRLAPIPFDPKATGDRAIEVRWEVSTDQGFSDIVSTGVAIADPNWAHSVHVLVDGLSPAHWYYYRFICGGEQSPVGRTKTAPAPGLMPDRLRFAQASCQSFTDGHYAAYADMAAREHDFVLHLGDYIYESDYIAAVRRIPVSEAYTLDDYRALYAQYKLDGHLQAAHAAAPWLIIWDDHEVDNDYGGDRHTESDLDQAAFLQRRTAAYQAFFEHLPLPLRARPDARGLRLYQRSVFGRLLELNLLDFRQHRHQDESDAALGRAQSQWLRRGLGSSGAAWTGLAQTTVMAPMDLEPGPEQRLDLDGWDGFPGARQNIIETLRAQQVSNPVSLGGNIHAHYAGVVPSHPSDPVSDSALTEIVTTSISSAGGGDDRYHLMQRLQLENPFMRYFENRKRGYVRNTLTPQAWTVDFMTVENVLDANSMTQLGHSLTIPAGHFGFTER